MWKSLLVFSDFVADVVRALPVSVILTRAAYISLMDFFWNAALAVYGVVLKMLRN